MEGAAVLERLTPVAQRAPGNWQIGTVTQIRTETPTVMTIRIALPMWMAHLPGQHYEVRLTAADGYTAQRSYSIASSPLEEGAVELLMCMLRHRRRTMPGLWMRLLYSVRTPADVIYAGELGKEVTLTYTKEA